MGSPKEGSGGAGGRTQRTGPWDLGKTAASSGAVMCPISGAPVQRGFVPAGGDYIQSYRKTCEGTAMKRKAGHLGAGWGVSGNGAPVENDVIVYISFVIIY